MKPLTKAAGQDLFLLQKPILTIVHIRMLIIDTLTLHLDSLDPPPLRFQNYPLFMSIIPSLLVTKLFSERILRTKEFLLLTERSTMDSLTVSSLQIHTLINIGLVN